MKFMGSLLIFSLLILDIYGAATDLEIPTVRPVTAFPTIDVSKHKTTTTESPTTTSTQPSSTTSSTTSSTPTSNTTSTTSDQPPTTSTTTQRPTPTTTTTQRPTPTTTTTQRPTPTPTPTPSEPTERNWTFSDGNRTCILIELATQLNVSYITNDNKTKYLVYNIPKDSASSVNGSCGNANGTSDQFIRIQWTSDMDAQNTLNMAFKLNHTTNEFSLKKIVFELDKSIFPNDSNLSSHTYYYVGSFFATPKQNSYHCTRPQILNLTNSENENSTVIGTVSFSHTLLEAFHEGKNTQFSTSIDCDAINTPDIVPIAVGIALIALVVIVLIAYVIGRRRSQAHGYVSM